MDKSCLLGGFYCRQSDCPCVHKASPRLCLPRSKTEVPRAQTGRSPSSIGESRFRSATSLSKSNADEPWRHCVGTVPCAVPESGERKRKGEGSGNEQPFAPAAIRSAGPDPIARSQIAVSRCSATSNG